MVKHTKEKRDITALVNNILKPEKLLNIVLERQLNNQDYLGFGFKFSFFG